MLLDLLLLLLLGESSASLLVLVVLPLTAWRAGFNSSILTGCARQLPCCSCNCLITLYVEFEEQLLAPHARTTVRG
jgi:hypothetical protein